MTHHIKLLKPRWFDGMTQRVLLPAGRCLEIKGEGAASWVVEPEDGEGHFSIGKNDPNVVPATIEDMVSEPEYNDHESY